MLSQLKDQPLCIGLKQSQRALEEGRVRRAFVAQDADVHVTGNFVRDCRAMGVQLEIVDSMKRLGHAAGIDVGAAIVVVLQSDSLV